jgi:adenylate kinase family enzyme
MIIFFHGPPCSGKTTLSNKLSIELGVPRFSTDQIRINTIDLQSYDKNMAKKVFDQFIEMIELEHKNDVFLIAESMLISEYRKEKLFRHFGKWLVVVKCECSVSKALERLENRIRSRKNSEGKSGETLSQEKLL